MADVQDQGVPFPTVAPPQQPAQQPLNLTQILTQAQPPQFDPAQLQAMLQKTYQAKIDAEEKAANNSLATLENDRKQAAKMLNAEGIGPEVNLKWDANAKSAEYSTDPMQAFGSLASVFAIVASSFTRAPMANALNGAAAAMNGIRQRDDNAYKRGFEAFKTNAELALKRQELMHQQYGDALKLMETDATIGRARVAATAAKFGDELMLARIEAGADPEMWKLYEDRLRTATELPKAMQQVYEMDALQGLEKARAERAQAKTPEDIAAAEDKIRLNEQKLKDLALAKTAGRPLTPGAQKASRIQELMDQGMPYEEAARKVGEESKPKQGLELDAESADRMAKQYIAGDKSVAVGLGYGNVGAQNRIKLQQAITKEAKNQGLSPDQLATRIAEFHGLIAEESTLGRREAQVEMAVSEAQLLAPLALQASEKVNRTKFPAFNEILLAGERGSGDENVVRLGVATNSLINVYARAISPAGVPTVSDKDHARELLSAAWSGGQYKAGVDQLMKEMAAAKEAPGKVKQDIERGKPSTPDDTGWTTLPDGTRIREKPGKQGSLQPPISGARQAADGKWYLADPDRPGKYLMVA